MNETTRHAMLRCRYILINRKLFSEATNEINFNQCVEELTAALEEFPPRQKMRDFAKFDEMSGSYLDTTEEFSQ